AVDVVGGDLVLLGREVAGHRRAHLSNSDDTNLHGYYLPWRAQPRCCVIVSISAGLPRLTSAMARFSAAAISPGLSIGPSAYQPMERASVAKSGGGPSMSMPI